MDGGVFIAADWGTTRLRLALCDEAGRRDFRSGPGIGMGAQSAEAIFLALTQSWRQFHGPIPAFLCGMVGSRNGWRETPYMACPADPASLRQASIRFDCAGCRVAITPGLSCTNPLGAPDVLRGEETQIIGAIAAKPLLQSGRFLLGLPGTHSKWVSLDDGRVERFLTVPTGELYALLNAHSTLMLAALPDAPKEAKQNNTGFRRGLFRQRALAGSDLLQTLFEVRSRQLLDKMTVAEAEGFLSGLLIGADVAGALRHFGADRPVHLIGEKTLLDLYCDAFDALGVRCSTQDGADCAILGLRRIYYPDATADA